MYDIYKGLGIKLRRPQQVYVRSRSELAELKDKRRIFATSLQAAIDSELDVIYMDETTVSSIDPLFKCKFISLFATFSSLVYRFLSFHLGKHAYEAKQDVVVQELSRGYCDRKKANRWPDDLW